MAERERRRDTGLRLDQPRETRRALLPRPALSQETFGRWSEAFARFMGTAQFLIAMTVFVVAWILWNTLAPEHLRFDKYAFIFLTLMLSLQASYAAPLILLAQNRQADRDRVALEQDRARDERNPGGRRTAPRHARRGHPRLPALRAARPARGARGARPLGRAQG
jgi:uncharacterized membrane protein